MKKQSKYQPGSTFYLSAMKQDAMVIAPVIAGTIAYIVPANDPNQIMQYNIRTNKLSTNHCNECQKNKNLRVSK